MFSIIPPDFSVHASSSRNSEVIHTGLLLSGSRLIEKYLPKLPVQAFSIRLLSLKPAYVSVAVTSYTIGAESIQSPF
jgi:hypothetical protein